MLKSLGDAYARYVSDNEDVCGPVGDLLDAADKLYHKLDDKTAPASTPQGQLRRQYVVQLQEQLGQLITGIAALTHDAACKTHQLDAERRRSTMRAIVDAPRIAKHARAD